MKKMDGIQIELANAMNFHEDSLDAFVRYQEVEYVYRLKNGILNKVYNPFPEDWTLERRREKAVEILGGSFITYCAFLGERAVGEIMLRPVMNKGRMIVDSFHVSGDMRRMGIGRQLLEAAKEEARRNGAAALYISACSSMETIDFYMAMGCMPSADPIREYAEDEPCDIQMELKL